MTQDNWTLQTIQGYRIPFCRLMRVTRIKCQSDAHHTERDIKDLLEKETVREVKPQDNQFTSKRKWRLSTYHQPSCSKSVLGEGVLQDGGTASSGIPNTAGRFHNEIRPERCILGTSNSSLRQKVSVVSLSGQSIRFSAFPLACPQLRGNSQRH